MCKIFSFYGRTFCLEEIKSYPPETIKEIVGRQFANEFENALLDELFEAAETVAKPINDLTGQTIYAQGAGIHKWMIKNPDIAFALHEKNDVQIFRGEGNEVLFAPIGSSIADFKKGVLD